MNGSQASDDVTKVLRKQKRACSHPSAVSAMRLHAKRVIPIGVEAFANAHPMGKVAHDVKAVRATKQVHQPTEQEDYQ